MHCRSGPRAAICASPRCRCARRGSASLPLLVHAEPVTPPPVPANIRILAGNKAFLVGHAIGTQNYSCLPAGVDAAGHPRYAWTLFTPQATLFAAQSQRDHHPLLQPQPVRARPESVCGRRDSRHVAGLEGHEHRLGQGRAGRLVDRRRLRRAGCHCLAADHGRRSRSRTHGRRHADADHLYPAPQHGGRGRTVDGLRCRRRMSATRRSCLTPPTTTSTGRPKATTSERQLDPLRAVRAPVG